MHIAVGRRSNNVSSCVRRISPIVRSTLLQNDGPAVYATSGNATNPKTTITVFGMKPFDCFRKNTPPPQDEDVGSESSSSPSRISSGNRGPTSAHKRHQLRKQRRKEARSSSASVCTADETVKLSNSSNSNSNSNGSYNSNNSSSSSSSVCTMTTSDETIKPYFIKPSTSLSRSPSTPLGVSTETVTTRNSRKSSSSSSSSKSHLKRSILRRSKIDGKTAAFSAALASL